MGKTTAFSALCRIRRLAHACEARGLPSEAGLEAAANFRSNRRHFLQGLGVGLATAVAPAAWAGKAGPSVSVGIVGAGLAGLNAAFTLEQAGLAPTLYEASDRVGGRQYSSLLGGQTIERGGELIDNLHKTMLGWVNRLGLQVEDLSKEPGDVFYFFDGTQVSESIVVDEYRAFVAAMRDDLRRLSGAPSATSHNDADVELDRTNLKDYLRTRGAGVLITKAIEEAYEAEYGLALEEQSALNFLLFIHADKRSKFTPFGVFSDERFHVVGGNDQIARGIAGELVGEVKFSHRLIRVREVADGVELTFDIGGRRVVRKHDLVILATPFSVLREVELLFAMPPEKRSAIDTLGYGTNAKTMLGFHRPYWRTLGCNGSAYSDLANMQNVWETSPGQANARHAVLTDFASAQRGASLDERYVQKQAADFLVDLDRVLPGALEQVVVTRGQIEAQLEAWPRNPLSKGSYTCYRPGQFTTLSGLESAPVGRIHFSGEHTNSFYVWQGFMEGGCLSGIDAANQILERL